jgi:hypothetical protein
MAPVHPLVFQGLAGDARIAEQGGAQGPVAEAGQARPGAFQPGGGITLWAKDHCRRRVREPRSVSQWRQTPAGHADFCHAVAMGDCSEKR